MEWQFSGGINPAQPLQDARFHRWYRFVLAYSDSLVTDLIGRYEIGPRELVLDPFCGTGTTLVVAKSQDIPSVGVDANPVAVFASRVKTEWGVDPQEVWRAVQGALRRYRKFDSYYVPPAKPDAALVCLLRRYLDGSPIESRVQYFEASGMLERKWMHELPMLQAFALLHMIETCGARPTVIDLLRLLLVCSVLKHTSNVAYGPELYVKRSKMNSPKNARIAFQERVAFAIDDLLNAPQVSARALAYEADSRNMADLLEIGSVTHLITSPPYPTEKDYTRNSRLELVFLGCVMDISSLQRVKKAMIRSHSKGIYKEDNDGDLVAGVESIERLATELEAKASKKTYGFAKLYPKIITEYFGGMRRHFRTLKPFMREGGIAAYVVGEQATYLQTYTATAAILSELAELEGFEVKEILPFRVRVGSTGGGRQIKEEVLVLRA
ncbi:MAG: DNA methyltransferase [Actinomycetota bacterium]